MTEQQYLFSVLFKVFLVTGGYHNGQVLDSTEILTEGASQWIYSGPLPSPRKELKAATVNNKIIATGTTEMFSLIFTFHCNSMF